MVWVSLFGGKALRKAEQIEEFGHEGNLWEVDEQGREEEEQGAPKMA